MATKTVYQTDRNGYYLYPVEARESPEDPGVFLLPRGCVETAPPTPGPNQWPAWNGSWWFAPDFRGVTGYRGKTPETVTELGKTLEDLGLTAEPPIQTLAELQTEKIAELKIACREAIEGGFISDALGLPHTYESREPQDQSNLIGAKLAGVDMLYTCIDQAGVKTQKLHTAAQIAQVFAAGVTWMQTQKTHYYARKAEVDAALTSEQVSQIAW